LIRVFVLITSVCFDTIVVFDTSVVFYSSVGIDTSVVLIIVMTFGCKNWGLENQCVPEAQLL